MAVTTRFAPSPTGMLHIGGARTALFNLLFARSRGGRFLLRIEDTDKARSTPEATKAILDGMAWLGLEADEPPIFQSARADRHVEVAHAMLENGTAFRCYATPEELQARRDEGEAKRQAAKAEDISDEARAALRAEADRLLAPFRSSWRDGADAPSDDTPFTVRLRAPDSGTLVLEDAVQGRIQIQAHEIDDMILLRADGTPTYMLTVVVDDHDMDVTHIIRGDDHLRNAFRQTPIYQAMGWDVPVFAHVPLIHGSDGKKLSKRHGAQSTIEYRDLGYLPEAMASYLTRLGWSHGDQEVFTLDEAASVFSLEGIGKAPARLDFDKLADVNRHFLRQAAPDRLLDLILPELEQGGRLDPAVRAAVQHAMPTIVERASTLPELAEAFAFLTARRPLQLNKKARKTVKGAGLDRLEALGELLTDVKEFDVDNIQNALQTFCDAQGLGMGQVGPPLRAALTGGLPAPDLAPVISWIGREEVLARLEDQIVALRGENETEEGPQ
ncbi:MAG: glutamate--tRNA ligase [Pseudomonadota bacterium]